MTEYLNRITICCDHLQAAGATVPYKEITITMLMGLPDMRFQSWNTNVANYEKLRLKRKDKVMVELPQEPEITLSDDEVEEAPHNSGIGQSVLDITSQEEPSTSMAKKFSGEEEKTIKDKWRTKPLIYRLNERDGPEIIAQVLEERNWIGFSDESDNRNDWNLWWSPSPALHYKSFLPLKPWQFVNEIQLLNGSKVSRKDRLVRSIRSGRASYGDVYDFMPLAFVLPGDYVRFVLEYSKRNSKNDNFWILKPADKSRGRGIFVFKLLNELSYNSCAVVQKYLTNPLLVSGYKFDLRIYVCIASIRPLSIYAYHDGLVRFATVPFDLKNVRNPFSHMTNTSINKFSPSYDEGKGLVGLGCKWTLKQLRHHFYTLGISDWVLWQKIAHILVLTILCEARAINYDDELSDDYNCFELYGFDVIVDDQLNPWLLEVNRHPSLCMDCEIDQLVKKPLLHDLIDLVGIEDAVSDASYRLDKSSIAQKHKRNNRWKDPPSHIGGFQRLLPFSSRHYHNVKQKPRIEKQKNSSVDIRSVVKKIRQIRHYLELSCRIAEEKETKCPLEDWEYEEILTTRVAGKKDLMLWTPTR
ncbi:hypothetical protein CHUAL_012007 [Chamberlinius hualienensis]